MYAVGYMLRLVTNREVGYLIVEHRAPSTIGLGTIVRSLPALERSSSFVRGTTLKNRQKWTEGGIAKRVNQQLIDAGLTNIPHPDMTRDEYRAHVERLQREHSERADETP